MCGKKKESESPSFVCYKPQVKPDLNTILKYSFFFTVNISEIWGYLAFTFTFYSVSHFPIQNPMLRRQTMRDS